MKNRYKIHVSATLRLNEISQQDGFIEVDDVPGLDEAILLVNKACSDELLRRKMQMKVHLFDQLISDIRDGKLTYQQIWTDFNKTFELKEENL